jgi:hypothetical protein
MHQDGTVLLLDQAGDSAVVDHRAQPEPWHSERGVLDVLDITAIDFHLLVILIIEFIGAGVELGKN